MRMKRDHDSIDDTKRNTGVRKELNRHYLGR